MEKPYVLTMQVPVASYQKTYIPEPERTVNWELHKQVARIAPHIAEAIYDRFPDRMGNSAASQRTARWQLIMQRLADGYLEYGDDLFTMSREDLQTNIDEEEADLFVYRAEMQARDHDVSE